MPAAISVNVEHIFLCGRLLVRNGLKSAQSICALLCLAVWSLLELINDRNIEATVENLVELEGDDKVFLEDGWGRIWLLPK